MLYAPLSRVYCDMYYAFIWESTGQWKGIGFFNKHMLQKYFSILQLNIGHFVKSMFYCLNGEKMYKKMTTYNYADVEKYIFKKKTTLGEHT